MKKKIRSGGKRVQKNVERTPLASFVSGVYARAVKVVRSKDTREIRMGIGLAIALVLLIGLALFYRPGVVDRPVDGVPDEVAIEDFERHPFTGERIEEVLDEPLHVFGVMVENAYDSWPLSGVEEAFLVIEAPVEGNIPRLLTLFASDKDVREIGPVRSARPYYVDWAHGWRLPYAHVGGSPEALDLIPKLGVRNINEFYNSGVFWRAGNRFAPHNTYTSIARLIAHVEKREFPTQGPMFTFKEPSDVGVDADNVHIRWSGSRSVYDVNWKLEEGQYVRSQGGKIARSTSNGLYYAANVITIETDIRSIDAVDRKRLRTTGEGEAQVFQNGHLIEAKWKKASVSDPLTFVDMWGEEIKMLPGATWIEVIPNGGLVTVTPSEDSSDDE